MSNQSEQVLIADVHVLQMPFCRFIAAVHLRPRCDGQITHVELGIVEW